MDNEAQPRRRVTAETMAAKQRDISVSEFFAKNRHLLGFDSPRKALLTAVKEAVDNSLDACEEARILPQIEIEIKVANGNGTPPAPESIKGGENKPPAKEGDLKTDEAATPKTP